MTVIQMKDYHKEIDFERDLAMFTERQNEAIDHLDSGKTKFLLYGGALGGGKSYLLRWYGIRRLMILHQYWGLTNVAGMLACEDYPSLEDRQLQKIIFEFPPWLGKYYSKHQAYGRCFILNKRWGGSALCFRNLDDPSKYASSEWVFILVDELTKNDYDVFTFLRTRLRLPGLPDAEAQFIGGTNPGSIGHGWVKSLWMDKIFPVEWTTPVDYRPMFAYVRSLASDNPHLDEAYWAMLATLPENLRKPFRDGNWDIFVGQAFPELGVPHKIDPMPIPRNAHLYMSYDWGWGAPFSIGWWFVDADGRMIRFKEWYGASGPNTGLRMADSDVAEQVSVLEKSIGKEFDLPLTTTTVAPNKDEPTRTLEVTLLKGIIRLAGHDSFQKKPNYFKGGGQGPSTSEVFSRYKIFLIVGDSSRDLKIRQVRERLRVPKDGSRPMLQVFRTCEDFFRTMTSLTMDDKKIEDVDTKGEDHSYDEMALMCMYRPLALPGEKEYLTLHDKRIIALKRGNTSGFEAIATTEQERELRRLGFNIEGDFGEVEHMEDGQYRRSDGDLKPTIT
jgi:phage terminase large subunit